MPWDFFISYASEDREDIVRPLATLLMSAGSSVWFDVDTLEVGDSIMLGINEGLKNSQYGIAILSPHYFEKTWTKRELGAFMTVVEASPRRILPVWHRVSLRDVVAFAPMLGDIRAAATIDGLNVVADQLLRASYPEHADNLALATTDPIRDREQLWLLLSQKPSVEDVRAFLGSHRMLMRRSYIFGMHSSYADRSFLAAQLGRDLPVGGDFFRTDVNIHRTGGVTVEVLKFGNIAGDTDLAREVNDFISSLGERHRPVEQSKKRGEEAGEERWRRGDTVSWLIEFPTLMEMCSDLKEVLLHGASRRPTGYVDTVDAWQLKLRLLHGRRNGDRPLLDHRIDVERESGVDINIGSYDHLLDHLS